MSRYDEEISKFARQKFIGAPLCPDPDLFVGGDPDPATLLFPYFVDLNQIEMSERAREWYCRLSSLVNFGAYANKRPRREARGE